MSSGNRSRGSRKRSAAFAGIGLQQRRGRGRAVAVTEAGIAERMRRRLEELVRSAAPESEVAKYLRGVARDTRKRRSSVLVCVTLVEGPAEVDSVIAAENSRSGGASLRIIEPSAEYPAIDTPPPLKRYACVNWPLDVHTEHGRALLEQYCAELVPVRGTDLQPLPSPPTPHIYNLNAGH